MVLSWILPNHYYPWSTAYQDFASFFSIILLFFGAVCSFKIKAPKYFFVFILVATVPFIQFCLGVVQFFSLAFFSSLYILGFFFSLLVGYAFFRGSLGKYYLLDVLAISLILGAILSLWIALRQWLLLSGSIWVVDLPYGGRPFANLAQPNNLATLICMGLAAVFYIYEKSCIGRLVFGVLAAFLLFGIALTQSRTPWVGLLVVTCIWFFKRRSYRSKLDFGIVCMWLFYYALCVFFLPKISESLLLQSVSVIERAQSLERLALWEQLWHAIWQGPWWGYGWGQVSLAQISMSSTYPVQMITEHSHNIILDLMLWNGPFLGGALIIFGFYFILKVFWLTKTVESLFALFVLGFLLVHGLLEFPLEYAFFLFPLGILLGSAAAENTENNEFYFPTPIGCIIFLFSFVLFFWVWREYRVVEEDYRLMRFESARIGHLKAEQPAPDVILLTQLREFLRFARTEPRQGMTASELEWMREVSYMPPYAPSLLRYALALGINLQPDRAVEQLELIRVLHGEDAYKNSIGYLKELQPKYPKLDKVLK